MNSQQQPMSQGVLGVVREAEISRFSGSVSIAGTGLAGTVFLHEGRVYWASIPGEADLSEIVARLPVNSIMLARIRWHMGQGLTLAEALDKLDDVDLVAVQRAVREVAETRSHRLLEVADGRAHLEPGVVAPVGVVVTWSLPSPQAAVRPAGLAPTPAGPVRLLELSAGPVQLDEVEWRVVAAFAAPQTAEALASRTGLSMAEVLAAVERLRQRRLAAAPPAGAREAPPAEPPRPAEPGHAPPVERRRPPEPRPAPVADRPRPPEPMRPPPAAPPRPADPSPAPDPRQPRPADAPVSGDRRSNALRRIISAVRGI